MMIGQVTSDGSHLVHNGHQPNLSLDKEDYCIGPIAMHLHGTKYRTRMRHRQRCYALRPRSNCGVQL